jgi:hypothetical protein
MMAAMFKTLGLSDVGKVIWNGKGFTNRFRKWCPITLPTETKKLQVLRFKIATAVDHAFHCLPGSHPVAWELGRDGCVVVSPAGDLAWNSFEGQRLIGLSEISFLLIFHTFSDVGKPLHSGVYQFFELTKSLVPAIDKEDPGDVI